MSLWRVLIYWQKDFLFFFLSGWNTDTGNTKSKVTQPVVDGASERNWLLFCSDVTLLFLFCFVFGGGETKKQHRASALRW